MYIDAETFLLMLTVDDVFFDLMHKYGTLEPVPTLLILHYTSGKLLHVSAFLYGHTSGKPSMLLWQNLGCCVYTC